MKVSLSFIALASVGSVASVSAFACIKSPRMASTRACTLMNNLSRSNSKTYHSSSLLMSTPSPMDYAKEEIASGKVVVFSKSFCPFCKTTKALFADNNIDAKIIELDEIANGSDIQDSLLELSGQRTVPNVFINGEHIGGNSETQSAWSSGELQKKLE